MDCKSNPTLTVVWYCGDTCRWTTPEAESLVIVKDEARPVQVASWKPTMARSDSIDSLNSSLLILSDDDMCLVKRDLVGDDDDDDDDDKGEEERSVDKMDLRVVGDDKNDSNGDDCLLGREGLKACANVRPWTNIVKVNVTDGTIMIVVVLVVLVVVDFVVVMVDWRAVLHSLVHQLACSFDRSSITGCSTCRFDGTPNGERQSQRS